MHNGSRFWSAVIYLVMVFVIFITIYPMYYIFILSVSDPIAAASLRVYVIPEGFYLRAYSILLANRALWRSFSYTLLYVSTGMFLTLFTSATCGYALSSPKLAGRKFFAMFLLIPMYFSGGLIPSFLLITRLGLYNTVLVLIITGSYSIFYIILAKSFFNSIPEALRESARIDGANNFTIFGRIYIPLSTPVLGVIAIYTVVGIWNSWFGSMIYQPNPDIQPLQMFLRRVLIEQTIDLAQLSAQEAEAMAITRLSNLQLRYSMIIITTLPIIFAYPFFQRYFVKGVMIGSIKG